jgi:two-component system cell cycle response regulator
MRMPPDRVFYVCAASTHPLTSRKNYRFAKLYYNYQKARRDSETDPLTGLSTRRVLEEVLKAEYARAIRYHHHFSVAIIDLDNLKQINDNAGHAAGDRTLRKLADIMRLNIRISDVVIARYGGDEFVLLMPETKLNEATILLERLRRRVSDTAIAGVGPMTISCGAAEWSGSAEDMPENMLQRADAALYAAKNSGRNRVIIAGKEQGA